MAHFLEIIRNLQSRLNSKIKRPAQRLVGFCFVAKMLCVVHVFSPMDSSVSCFRWMLWMHQI